MPEEINTKSLHGLDNLGVGLVCLHPIDANGLVIEISGCDNVISSRVVLSVSFKVMCSVECAPGSVVCIVEVVSLLNCIESAEVLVLLTFGVVMEVFTWLSCVACSISSDAVAGGNSSLGSVVCIGGGGTGGNVSSFISDVGNGLAVETGGADNVVSSIVVPFTS